MLKSAFVGALAMATAFIAAPTPGQAVTTAPAAEATKAVADLNSIGAGIQDVRWVRRCHTESRLRYTYYGRQWVPVRICNRVWEQSRYRPWRDRPWRDRNRYDRDWY